MNDVTIPIAHKEKVAAAHGDSDERQMRADVTGRSDSPSTPNMLERAQHSARPSNRRVVMTTCQAHGAVGFTNLLVTKEDGIIVLNPHVANCCVLKLDERAATALHNILTEWLG